MPERLMMEGKAGFIRLKEKPVRWMPSFFNVVYLCYLCVHAHVCAHAISHMLGSGGSFPLFTVGFGH